MPTPWCISPSTALPSRRPRRPTLRGPPGLADGFHTIVASETNLSGETGTSGDLNFTLDTTAPTLTISSSPTVLRGMVEAAIFFTFSEDPGSTFDPDAGPAPLLRLGRLW